MFVESRMQSFVFTLSIWGAYDGHIQFNAIAGNVDLWGGRGNFGKEFSLILYHIWFEYMFRLYIFKSIRNICKTLLRSYLHCWHNPTAAVNDCWSFCQGHLGFSIGTPTRWLRWLYGTQVLLLVWKYLRSNLAYLTQVRIQPQQLHQLQSAFAWSHHRLYTKLTVNIFKYWKYNEIPYLD